MGKNKAFIEIEGKPIIKRIYNLFTELFQEIIIVTNEIELFQALGPKVYSDLIPDKGVLGGLYTGIFYSTFPFSFCVACDMPFINKSIVHYLIQNLEDHDVIVPQTKDGLQPLHAFYSKNCLKPIRETIEQGKYKILDIYHLLRIKIIDEAYFIHLDPKRESFLNINTPDELNSIIKTKKQMEL